MRSTSSKYDEEPEPLVVLLGGTAPMLPTVAANSYVPALPSTADAINGVSKFPPLRRRIAPTLFVLLF